jgi:hypothetical protein
MKVAQAAGLFTHSGRDAGVGGGREAASRREAARAEKAVVVVVGWSRRTTGSRPSLARVHQTLRPGAHLSLSKADIGMDHTSGAPSRAGRPVDVAGSSGFHPTQAGAVGRCGSTSALGETLRHRPPDTDSGPPRRFGAFGATWHAGEAAETLRKIARTAKRPPLGPGETLPGRQEDRLNPHEHSERGSFARDIKPLAKLSCLKRKPIS